MTRTPDEIKKGMAYCVEPYCPGEKCPYWNAESCAQDKTYDALAYIQQLEERAHQLDLLNLGLLVEKAQLEAERDAAVSELVGTCQVCRWEETAKCASCHFCEDAWNVCESNWQWRGVQKEE